MFEWAIGGMSVNKASALVREGRDLDLRDIRTLDAPVARVLAANGGALYLNGIVRLSKEAERALAHHSGEMSLDNLTELHTAELAEKFIRQNTQSLFGIEMLSHEAQEVFARAPREIYMPDLRSITSAAFARKIVQDDCHDDEGEDVLVLRNLERLSPDAADEFAKYEGELCLPCLCLSELASDAVRFDPLGAYQKQPYARLIEKLEASGDI